jgi:hypothetical protein
MNSITVDIFAVCENDEILIARSIVLNFVESVGTFPMPSFRNTEKALQEQRPDVWERIPVRSIGRGFSETLGLRFERSC